MPRNKILLVDDDESLRAAVAAFLRSRSYEVLEAGTCAEGLELFRSAHPDACVLDYSLPDGNALDLLPRMKQVDAWTPLILLSGHGSIELAVQAVKEGAEQFLTKPVQLQVLQVVLQRVLENQRTRQKHMAATSVRARSSVDPFLGESAAIRRLAELAEKVLGAERPLLIQGETGAGKGVLARWLHENSPRRDEAFVDLNCAGLNREFLETELFGHEKGAFTGAVNAKPGLLEVGHRGTLFLDEIGDVDVQVQPKLLKVLEEKQFRRLGEVRDRRVDIRLIAATHQDLETQVREKKFRSDLFFRISTIQLRIPPLRERPEDIALLAEHLLERFCSEMGRPPVAVAPDALEALRSYAWPGNIRELRNILERAIILSTSHKLARRDLDFGNAPMQAQAWSNPDNVTLAELERHYVTRVMQQANGKVEAAARVLGISRSSLYVKLREYQLLPEREGNAARGQSSGAS